MNQKIIALMSLETLVEVQKNAALVGSVLRASSVIHNGKTVTAVAIYPHHAHLRFEIPTMATGVTVLPGMHDPAPIGDLHQHLAHVDAQPHETMRQVALRLHDAHGPAFHPDT